MKETIYSKKYPKTERKINIQEDFEELVHRQSEDELWVDVLKTKYRHSLLAIDDLNPKREKAIIECVEYAKKNRIDIEILKSTENLCINLSFDGMVDVTPLKELLGFADEMVLVSEVKDRDITLSLMLQTHKNVFFKNTQADN